MEVTESGFIGSAWCPAATFGLFTGLLCLAISWLVFDLFSLVVIPPLRYHGVGHQASESSRRSWSRPIICREYICCAGGVPWTIMRIAVPFGIFLCVCPWVSRVFGGFEIGFAFAWSSIFCGLFGVLDGSWSASRLFRDEIRYRTWSSLVQTPCTLKQVVFDKYCGWALGLAPTIIAPFVMVFAMFLVHKNIQGFMNYVEVIIGAASFGISVFGYLNLLVLLSLYFGWKLPRRWALTICFTMGFFYVSSSKASIDGRQSRTDARCIS